MKTTNFIEIGLVSAALIIGASVIYSNGIDSKIKEEFNPVNMTSQVAHIDTQTEMIKKKVSTGIQDAEYLKFMNNKDLSKDIKDLRLIKHDLETLKTLNNLWKEKNKSVLSSTGNYESWSLLEKINWINKSDKLKDNIKRFNDINRDYVRFDSKIDSMSKESKDVTNDFIAKNVDINKLLDTLNKSHKSLNVLNDKALATEKIVNYLHSNANIIDDFKIKDTQEKAFNTNIYVGKISVVTNSLTHILKEQDNKYKDLNSIKDKPLNTSKDQREWVIAVKNVNIVLSSQNEEKIEKIKKDLESVEKEVNPAFAQIKELENELKDVVLSKIKDKKFDLNAIASKYKENIKKEVESDIQEARANDEYEVVNNLNEIESIAITKIEEDKTLVNELVQKVNQENNTANTATNNSGGMNLFHYYLMYSWLNSSSNNTMTMGTTPTTPGVASGFAGTNKFINNANSVNNLTNRYTVKTADGGYSTENIIGSKVNNNMKTKSTTSYRSVSVRKVSVGVSRSSSMGG